MSTLKPRAAILGMLIALQPFGAGAEWQLRPPTPTDKPANRCLIQTATVDVFDGYNTTQAHIEVGRAAVMVKTTAVLDPGFNDVGFTVDTHPFVAADRYDGQRTLLFEKDYAGAIEQFKRGREVKLALRFWPTWPATGPHEVAFSLIGFAKAYEELQKCRPE